ncbi:MAG: hypothetical protein AB7U61_00970 [Methylocystis sp.]
MSLQIAATPAPAMHAENGRQEIAQVGDARTLLSEHSPKAERTDTDLDAWSSRAIAAGVHLRRAVMAFNRAVCCQHAASIGNAYESIDDAKADLDDLLDEALEDHGAPSRELLATAAREYRAQPRAALSLAPPPTTKRQRRPAPKQASRETSEATTRERERLRRAHPPAWEAGERAGLNDEGAPLEFTGWSADQKAAFFAAAYLVSVAKLRGKK